MHKREPSRHSKNELVHSAEDVPVRQFLHCARDAVLDEQEGEERPEDKQKVPRAVTLHEQQQEREHHVELEFDNIVQPTLGTTPLLSSRNTAAASSLPEPVGAEKNRNRIQTAASGPTRSTRLRMNLP